MKISHSSTLGAILLPFLVHAGGHGEKIFIPESSLYASETYNPSEVPELAVSVSVRPTAANAALFATLAVSTITYNSRLVTTSTILEIVQVACGRTTLCRSTSTIKLILPTGFIGFPYVNKAGIWTHEQQLAAVSTITPSSTVQSSSITLRPISSSTSISSSSVVTTRSSSSSVSIRTTSSIRPIISSSTTSRLTSSSSTRPMSSSSSSIRTASTSSSLIRPVSSTSSTARTSSSSTRPISTLTTTVRSSTSIRPIVSTSSSSRISTTSSIRSTASSTRNRFWPWRITWSTLAFSTPTSTRPISQIIAATSASADRPFPTSAPLPVIDDEVDGDDDGSTDADPENEWIGSDEDDCSSNEAEFAATRPRDSFPRHVDHHWNYDEQEEDCNEPHSHEQDEDCNKPHSHDHSDEEESLEEATDHNGHVLDDCSCGHCNISDHEGSEADAQGCTNSVATSPTQTSTVIKPSTTHVSTQSQLIIIPVPPIAPTGSSIAPIVPSEDCGCEDESLNLGSAPSPVSEKLPENSDINTAKPSSPTNSSGPEQSGSPSLSANALTILLATVFLLNFII